MDHPFFFFFNFKQNRVSRDLGFSQPLDEVMALGPLGDGR